jgi:hypothetical protein
MKIKITNNCTHAHKLKFENSSTAVVHCSGKNIISPNPNGGWEAHNLHIVGTVIWGAGGGFKVNGDIALHDYPPLNCGNIVSIEYIGEVSEY